MQREVRVKQVLHESVVAVREEAQDRELRPARAAERESPRSNGVARTEEARCSVDPLHRTDRYRLVTPYVSSSKDL